MTATCPACGALLGIAGRRHCATSPACHWLRCACGAVVEPISGKHYRITIADASTPQEDK